MSRTPLKDWLLVALIFAVGMIAGASLMVAFRHEGPHEPPGAQQIRNHWLAHLTRALELTPDQQAKIEPILADAGNQIQALHRDEIDRISKIMDNANERIAPLLTPAQQEELKKIHSERERAFSGHLRPWDGPRGPGGPNGFPPGGPPPAAP